MHASGDPYIIPDMRFLFDCDNFYDLNIWICKFDFTTSVM